MSVRQFSRQSPGLTEAHYYNRNSERLRWHCRPPCTAPASSLALREEFVLMRLGGTGINLLLLAALMLGAVVGSSPAGGPAAAQVDVPRFEGAGCLFPVPPGENVECG